MSTKTTFKRIALVAVAALGLGVLSVAPSSAATTGLTLTATAGTAGNTAGTVTDTATAASIVVSALTTASSDTISVVAFRKSAPLVGTPGTARLVYADTATASTTVAAQGALGTVLQRTAAGANYVSNYDSTTGFTTAASTAYVIGGDAGFKNATFDIILETGTAPAAGTYVFTVVATVHAGAGAVVSQTTTDVNITVAALANASLVVDPSKSSASLGATRPSIGATDEVISTLATQSSTVKAVIRVANRNNAEGLVSESVTVTVTGPGVVRDGANTAVSGKSLVIVGDGDNDIEILSDGTAGTASISVRTTSVTFAPKSVTFYAANAATTVAAANKPVIAVGPNTNVIAATMKDSNGNVWAGQAYIYAASAADALIAGSETPATCTWTPSILAHLCPVSGKVAGTANFKVIDKATVATATAAAISNSVAVRVSTGVPTTAKLAFDKATYAPGEKAQIWVTALDAAGLALAEQTVSNIFAAGGITTSTALGTGSDTLTATFADIAGATSATAGTVAGYKVYTVYMPFASGDVTISATGGTGLAPAGRVAISATATVVNSSVDAATDAANEATDAANAATDAALAAADAADAATAAAQDASDAVAALSASVSKLISSLRAQITSLTNLVIKIQKKVRA
jgi:trimeric autotransporter adhesin